MPTELLPTRAESTPQENVSRGFGLALGLHLLVLVVLAAATLIQHFVHQHWGEHDPVAGSIQASMVNALPLPPRQRTQENAVLTSEKPSIAPTPPPPTPTPPKAQATPVTPKTQPPPRPNEVLIPNKVIPQRTPPRPAEREQPAPPRRAPAVQPPPTPKATTGETSGIQIPQSVTQLKNGTASITVQERAFGDRYAYYIRLISQKVNEAWNRQEADARASNGRRTTITFTIDRDGTPTEVHVSLRSGSPSLDASALHAIQRIDTFGPLPAGNQITIDFSFDFHTL